MASRKRNVLSLAERMKVIERSENGESCLSIARSLDVGKTQIQLIIKDKESVKLRWESGESGERKTSKLRASALTDLDERVWQWFDCFLFLKL